MSTEGAGANPELRDVTVRLITELAAMRLRAAMRSAEIKLNPNWALQPRAPRGTPIGGQWVRAGAGQASSEPSPSAPAEGRLTVSPPANDNRPGLVSIARVARLGPAITWPLLLSGDTPRPIVRAHHIASGGAGDLVFIHVTPGHPGTPTPTSPAPFARH